MSQVVSIVVTSSFDEACALFRDEADVSDMKRDDYPDCGEYIVVYDKEAHEIRCEGRLSNAAISALTTVRDRFGGKLLHEGVELNESGDEIIEEASPKEKMWIILAIVFFPVTLIYLFLRIVIWVPYKIWEATK